MRLPATLLVLIVFLLRMQPNHTSDNLDLGNAVGVTQDDTNLRRGSTLPGELADLFNDLVGSGLEPRGGGAGVGERGGRNALALAVKTAHLVGCGEAWCCGRVRVRGCRRMRRYGGRELRWTSNPEGFVWSWKFSPKLGQSAEGAAGAPMVGLRT